MSNVTPFDTLAMALALRDEAGFDQKQAEGTAKVLSRLLVADLATKADVSQLATKSDVREVELRLEAKIEATKSDLLKTLIGAVAFNSAVVLGAMFGLAKLLGH